MVSDAAQWFQTVTDWFDENAWAWWFIGGVILLLLVGCLMTIGMCCCCSYATFRRKERRTEETQRLKAEGPIPPPQVVFVGDRHLPQQLPMAPARPPTRPYPPQEYDPRRAPQAYDPRRTAQVYSPMYPGQV
ncbi:MAG: hypothetical protein KVP17_001934 [Porospora cf. gigantea B]|uniref:uncharacterized protein n=1 Tax=Porospora cf. gigantea B TaxID=2853592 RepID=UPI003571F7F5|nr:MAG: hypothetical protein KVP17_001934 [Porospora cf. gigantea B]